MNAERTETNGDPLRLRIPEPARGDRDPDRVRFVSAAGEMKKPDLDEKVERVALMRKQLVRVIADDGSAVGEWVPDLTDEQKIAGLRDMMLVRSFDARLLRAHRQGIISFYMQSPSGFGVEFGFSGRLIDDSTWTVGNYSKASIWGHRRTAVTPLAAQQGGPPPAPAARS